MKFIAVLAFVITSSAFAGEYVSQKLSFSPRTNTMGNQYYYNCSFLEDAAESHLKKLGATNVRARCTGGLEMGMGMPAHIKATFDAPVAGSSVARAVVIRGTESCQFHTEFLDRAVKLFPAASVVNRRASCSGGRLDSWKYTFSITE